MLEKLANNVGFAGGKPPPPGTKCTLVPELTLNERGTQKQAFTRKNPPHYSEAQDEAGFEFQLFIFAKKVEIGEILVFVAKSQRRVSEVRQSRKPCF